MESLSSTLKDDFLTCMICYEVFTEPKTLPCLHSYCKSCIFRYNKEKQSDPPYTCSCPVCRESFSMKLEEIKTNFCLANMIDLIKKTSGSSEFCSFCLLMEEKRQAVSQCLTCLDYLCEECGKMRHAFTRQTRDHKVVSMKDVKTGKFEKEIRLAQKERCSKHADEILIFFCMSCQLPVCRDCLIYEHREHKFKLISELRKTKEKEINGVINPLKEKLKDLQNSCASISVELKDCEAKEKKILEEVSTKCLEAIDTIKLSQRNMEKEIKTQMYSCKENLQHAIDNISKHCKNIEESITFSNNILMGGNDFEVLQILDEIYERVLNLNRLECSDLCRYKDGTIPEYKITWKEPQLLSFSIKPSDTHMSTTPFKENYSEPVEPVIKEDGDENAEIYKITAHCSSEHICNLPGSVHYENSLSTYSKKCVISLIRTLTFSVGDDQCTPVHSSVTWTRDGRVVAIDKMSEKVLSIALSTDIKKSVRIPHILSISANSTGFVCKTLDGHLLKLDRQFGEIRRYEGVSTIVSTSPNSSSTIWMTKNKIVTEINGKLTETHFYDGNGDLMSLRTPTYACYLPNRTFAVSDFDTKCVYLISNSGKILREISHDPGSISCDGDGHIYIANFFTHTISIFDINGKFLSNIEIRKWQKAPRCISIFKNKMLIAGDHLINMYDMAFQ